jgi:hypothetical protein
VSKNTVIRAGKTVKLLEGVDSPTDADVKAAQKKVIAAEKAGKAFPDGDLAIIDEALLGESKITRKKIQDYFFSEKPSGADFARFIKGAYGLGGGGGGFRPGTMIHGSSYSPAHGIYIDVYKNGPIPQEEYDRGFAEIGSKDHEAFLKKYGEENRRGIKLTWAEAARRIAELIEAGRYLPDGKAEKAPKTGKPPKPEKPDASHAVNAVIDAANDAGRNVRAALEELEACVDNGGAVSGKQRLAVYSAIAAAAAQIDELRAAMREGLVDDGLMEEEVRPETPRDDEGRILTIREACGRVYEPLADVCVRINTGANAGSLAEEDRRAAIEIATIVEESDMTRERLEAYLEEHLAEAARSRLPGPEQQGERKKPESFSFNPDAPRAFTDGPADERLAAEAIKFVSATELFKGPPPGGAGKKGGKT